MAAMAPVGIGLGKEPEASSGSTAWVAGTQTLGPPVTAFPDD